MKIEDKILLYQKTGAGEKDLVDEIYIFIYQRIQRLYILNEDEKSDFFLYVIPRVKRLLHTYRNIGRTFKAYLGTHINFQVNSFMRTTNEEKRKQALFHEPYLFYESGLPVLTAEPDNHYASLDEIVLDKFRQTSDTMRKRLLFFILKYSDLNSSLDYKKLSEIIKIPEELLCHYIDEAHIIMFEKKQKHAYTRERHRYYLFKLYYTLHMQQVCVTQDEKEKYFNKSAMYMHHIYKLQRIVNASPHSLSNREVGEILNVPKGTVDSGLHHLKHFLTLSEEKASEPKSKNTGQNNSTTSKE